MMQLLSFLFGKRDPSASLAKERLQIVVSQQRASRSAPDFLPLLQQEVLAVVGKYLEIDDDGIEIRHSQNASGAAVLDINIELDKARVKQMPRRAARNGEPRQPRTLVGARSPKPA